MVDAVDQLLEIVEQPVIAHALEIEGRQRHHAGAAKLDSMARQGDGFRKVAQACSGNDDLGVDAGGDKALKG